MCLQFVINSVDIYVMTTTCLLKFSWAKVTFFPGADTFFLGHVHFMLVTLHLKQEERFLKAHYKHYW